MSGARFVEHLDALARREDRGALAALRRGLGKPPGTVTAMLPFVVPFLPERRDEHAAYFLVASLFALHPEGAAEGNLGTTFKQLGDHESAQKRFVALLDCHADELGDHLRHAISLARSKQVRVNYGLLLDHVLAWSADDRWVQRAWAAEYWAKGRDVDETDRGDGTDAAEGAA
jgi:CRISPR system Cascade subunit CasB